MQEIAAQLQLQQQQQPDQSNLIPLLQMMIMNGDIAGVQHLL